MNFRTHSLTLIVLCTITSLAVEATEVINAGVGGNRSSQLLKRLDKDVLAHDPDLVVVMVGTNDRLNSGKFLAIADYRKNVESLVESIISSGAEVILVTPPPCIPRWLFTRHDPAKFADRDPNGRMEEVRDTLIEIAGSRNIPLVDFFQHLVENDLAGNDRESVLLNPHNSDRRDGVHLTPDGYLLLAGLVAARVRTMDPKPGVIVCLGDSLTRGDGRDETGPETGGNYPAFLKSILDGRTRNPVDRGN